MTRRNELTPRGGFGKDGPVEEAQALPIHPPKPSGPSAEDWYKDVPRSIRSHAISGFIVMAVAFGGFVTWGATAPLAAAVIADGRFVPTGQNKIVQHLEGGIIEELLVAEGDVVEKGQPLLRLDRTAAESEERALALRELRLRTMHARLAAEASGAESYDDPTPSGEGIGGELSDEEIEGIRRSQRANFIAAQRKLENDTELMAHSIAALGARMNGYRSQEAAMERQIALLKEDEAAKRQLLVRGLARRPEVRGITRAIADAEGDRARLRSQIAEAQEQTARYERQRLQAVTEARQAALDEMLSVEAQLDDVREETRAAAAVSDRTTVVAPVRGIVFQLHYHTAGGVIESGSSIIELLPIDAPLIIEAMVPRMQIDEVRTGQAATVRLTALNQRTTPLLEGKVDYVSADTVREQGILGAEERFLARISVSPEELLKVTFSPTPGMPAEILIRTHERTFFDYLTKPVRDSMARAFREE